MTDKVRYTLKEASEGLKETDNDFYIIGASALLLSRIDIGVTKDIDILTTSENADILKKVWDKKRYSNPMMKENELFKSNFACFKFSYMDIEVAGDLKIYKGGQWSPLKVREYEIIKIENLSIKIPTLNEQIRILNLFGREKDIKRIKTVKRIIAENRS